jgi:CHAT domain-containing protein
VEGLKKLYPGTEDYKDEKMTKNTVKNRCNNADIIHFATHGLFDEKSPMFSKLILADDELNVYEIFDLNLNAYMVTLSACQTGLGDISDGDDLIGFSRAFIYGGTPTVCVSLWNVSDMATGELMKKFYYYLKNNNKSKSMRLAQLDIMKKYRHPFFWGPFVLIGDWK